VREISSFWTDEFANLILVVDGTEIPIRRPKDKEIQKAFYSPKKKQHSVTIIVIVTLDGRILYVSDPQIGPSDQRHWNQLQLRQLFVNKPYGIIGDAGFTFNPRNNNATEDNVEILGATRKKRPPHGDLSDKEKRQNRILSSMRAVVENVIGQIKNWKVLAGVFRHFSTRKHNQIDLDLVIRVVTKIVALQLQRRPLRSSTWQVPIQKIDQQLSSKENAS